MGSGLGMLLLDHCPGDKGPREPRPEWSPASRALHAGAGAGMKSKAWRRQGEPDREWGLFGKCCVLGLFSHVQLFASPWTVGSSVHGILQARTLERVAVPSSRGSS